MPAVELKVSDDVTWTDGGNGSHRYGTVNKILKNPLRVEVDDVLYPVRHELLVSEVKVVRRDIRAKWDDYPVSKYQDAEFKKALAVSKKIRGIKPGKLLATGVGDGYAWYIVTKVAKDGRTANVEWRGFSPDRWVDQMLGYRKNKVPVSMLQGIIWRDLDE